MRCRPLSNELHKMTIYGQTLSKQGGGTKWVTIHKNLPTNCAQCTCSTSIVYTNELGKRKAAVVSLRPTKRTRSTPLTSLPQEATKNMEVYKISGSPKIDSSTSLTLLIRYFNSFFNSCLAYSTFSSFFCHLYHMPDTALGVYVYH